MKRKLSARAKRNIDWIHAHLRVPEGRLAGQPVMLSPAQIDWMEMIYGSPTRTFICSLPRKNGKTSFSAMLLLLHLVGPEAVTSGQIYSCAQSRDQAAILFRLASLMVRMSPDLSQYVSIKESAKMLVCSEIGTAYKALSAEASTALGLSPAMVIHDELGAVRGPRFDLYEALETASAAQANPLSIIISTQAAKPDDLLSVLIADAKTGADPRVKCVLYSVPSDGDPFDRDQLAAAQPNWHLMNHDEVFRQMEEAKRMPSREASFRNLVANQMIEASNPFVSRASWMACSDEMEFDPDLPVYGGLDLSARTDLTAFVLVQDRGEKIAVKSYFWTPEVGLYDRAKRDRAPYDVWVKDGHLLTTPGATVDYEYVAQNILDILEEYHIGQIAFDRWRIDLIRKEFVKLGAELPLVECGQGFKDMSPAIDSVEAEILNGRFAHASHPVLNMCAANAIVTRDPAGNRKLDKSKATGRIDGMVALAMAMFAMNGSEQSDDAEFDEFINRPLVVNG